jgi:hypothetical protein
MGTEERYRFTEDLEISVNGSDEEQGLIMTEEIEDSAYGYNDVSTEQDDFDPKKVLELIDIAAYRAMNAQRTDYRSDETQTMEEDKKYSNASKIIDRAADEILIKQQSDYIKKDIEKRFHKIKNLSDDNFNMFELVLQCHKLVCEYKKLAKLNDWNEIEILLSEDI